jgi:hypothetical protein
MNQDGAPSATPDEIRTLRTELWGIDAPTGEQPEPTYETGFFDFATLIRRASERFERAHPGALVTHEAQALLVERAVAHERDILDVLKSEQLFAADIENAAYAQIDLAMEEVEADSPAAILEAMTEPRQIGNPTLTLVTGAPSRANQAVVDLGLRLLHRPGVPRPRLVTGRAKKYHRRPYGPFIEGFSSFRAVGHSEEMLPLSGLYDNFLDLSSRESSIALTGKRKQEQFDFIAGKIKRAASIQSLAIALQDVQWADQNSLEFILHLRDTVDMPALRLLATMTHRPLRPHPLLSRLEERARSVAVTDQERSCIIDSAQIERSMHRRCWFLGWC